ncbi:MAG: MATE family efflux transporter [Bacteroidales bacterium]|jgi:putative MATE family efflux protein|nr:MATE family efflux transporter [Bacteroidales bacterium]
MKDLSVGNEGRLIFQFATPMLLGNMFQQLYNVVDSIIVGNYIGKEALAAVGSSFPIIFTLISFIIGIAIGSTVIISQYFGAKDFEKIKRAIDTLYIFIFFASLFVSLLGIYFSTEIFRLLGLPEEVIPMADSYLVIYLSGLVLFFGFNATSAILRGLGDSRTPLYFMIIATIMNIGFDFLFVAGFGWGIQGAAFATIVAQGGAFVTAIIYLNRTHEIINLSWRKMVFDREIFRANIRIGIPIGLQQSFVALSMMVMYWLVNPFGTNTVAAYSVVFRIDSFAAMPAMNFAAALSTFVGQNLGANKPHRVRTGLISTALMTSAFAITVSSIAFIFAGPLMRLFTNDQEVIRQGVEYLHIVSPFYIVFTAMFTVGGVMRGAGDTFIPMLITFIALWVVRIPLCYYLSIDMGVKGIWWGIPGAWFTGLVLSFLYYLSGRWKSKAIIKHDVNDQ